MATIEHNYTEQVYLGNGRWTWVDPQAEQREREAREEEQRKAEARAALPPIISYTREQRTEDAKRVLSIAGKAIAGALRPTLQEHKDDIAALKSRVADASVVAALQEELRVTREELRALRAETRSGFDKQKQVNSGTFKQVQAIERKFGEFVHTRSIP